MYQLTFQNHADLTAQREALQGQRDFEYRQAARTQQMLAELASDLADLVESGDLTEEEANEWMVCKQEQWK